MVGVPRTTRRGWRGLTLVEILIALTLVAVVLLPVMSGLSQALISTSESSITVAATSVARDTVERIKGELRRPGYDFDLLASQPRAPADLRPGDDFFEVEVTVEMMRANDFARSGLKRVVVAVYQAGSNRPVSTITTLVTPSGV